MEYRNIDFTVWDIGGQDKIRPLWRHYYRNTHAVIYVVDTSDVDRLDQAREELMKALDDEELRDAAVLVFANKQDLPRALPAAEVTEKLGMHSMRGRQWWVQGCCGTLGDGLYDGLDWLCEQLAK